MTSGWVQRTFRRECVAAATHLGADGGNHVELLPAAQASNPRSSARRATLKGKKNKRNCCGSSKTSSRENYFRPLLAMDQSVAIDETLEKGESCTIVSLSSCVCFFVVVVVWFLERVCLGMLRSCRDSDSELVWTKDCVR